MTTLVRFVAMSSATLLLLSGCSQPTDGRMEVSGTVNLKGAPLDNGIILFEPLGGQDTGGSAEVVDGRYSIPRENGLKPGKYLIRVTSGDGVTAINPVDPDAGPGPTGGTNIVSKDRVPADWNVRSKQEVTVTAEGPNTFDFDIK